MADYTGVTPSILQLSTEQWGYTGSTRLPDLSLSGLRTYSFSATPSSTRPTTGQIYPRGFQ